MRAISILYTKCGQICQFHVKKRITAMNLIDSNDKIRLFDMLRGFAIYATGDIIAQLLLGNASLFRFLCIGFIGATVYALEIPIYFRIIDRFVCSAKYERLFGYFLARRTENANISSLNSFGRTIFALLFFNPLWIARHFFFISVIDSISHETIFGNPYTVFCALIPAACKSFAVNIPLSLVGNFIIQNKLNIRHRFTGSAIFSGICAIWYAISKHIFS